MHVVATAGHVDHGKSTLVRALTGMEPDRWAEERRRGLTIDLGYAWTTLPTGAEVAFVDVPGHERFIANMLAGIGPVASVLFVVAADAGWSRQSEEHLRAIDALGLQHGLVAVTRSDLADAGAALGQARERIARTSLGEVEAVAVSGSTGLGLEELRAALGRLLAASPPPDPQADLRLWLDRSFTVRGSGTVVTGTLSAGRVAVGDRLDLRGVTVGVRGIESLGVTRQSIDAPARVALNLRGVDRSEVGRGDMLLTPHRWHRTSVVDVRLDTTDDLAAELMLHVGTVAVAAHVRPLGAATVRLSLASALPLRAGDRAVLRDPGQQSIVSGALVLDADPPELSRRGAARARGAQLAFAPFDARAEIERRGLVTRTHLRKLGVAVTDDDDVRSYGDWLVAPHRWDGWVREAPEAVQQWADTHPLDPAMPRAALRHALALPDDDALLTAVVGAAGLELRAGAVRVKGREAVLPPAVAELVRRLTDDPFAAPDRDQLAELGLGPRDLAAAERAGVLVRVAGDIVLRPAALDEATDRLAGLPATFTLSQARQALGSTRRVVVPLLEHLDRLGRTERVDATTRRISPRR